MLFIEKQLIIKTKGIKTAIFVGIVSVILHIISLVLIIILRYYQIPFIANIHIMYIIVYYFGAMFFTLFGFLIYIPGIKKEVKKLEKQLEQAQKNNPS